MTRLNYTLVTNVTPESKQDSKVSHQMHMLVEAMRDVYGIECYFEVTQHEEPMPDEEAGE